MDGDTGSNDWVEFCERSNVSTNLVVTGTLSAERALGDLRYLGRPLLRVGHDHSLG